MRQLVFGSNLTYTRSLVIIAIFAGLSVAAGLAKIPTPVGSVALDSIPGYFVAVYYSPVLGGVTAFFGHLGSAASAGFPLGLLHLSIACLQLLWVFLFGLTVRRIDKSWAFAIAIPLMVGLNGYVSPHLLAFFLGTSDPRTQAIIGLIPFLVIATLINALLASILYVAVLRTSKRERHPEYKAP